MAKKARQAYQYEAPVTPSKWTGEEQRFSIRVKAVLEDLYQKFSFLSGKDASIGGKTWAERLLDIYPVGSIYISVNSTSPASLFGGTWEQLKDRFLLGAGSSYSNGATGGAATHTLTVNEIPSHIHELAVYGGEISAGGSSPFDKGKVWAQETAYDWSDYSDRLINYTGGGQAHNNMPPYIAVYMWKRVA